MMLKAYVGVTDGDWFEVLASQTSLDEVNFWQPGGSKRFSAIAPGELFLWKLHSPLNFIVGGGIFAHASRLPVSIAWEAFGIANGAYTLPQMRARIEWYRGTPTNPHDDYTIGCILLEQPFFLPRDRWIPVPPDWKPQIVQGRTYDLSEEPGRSLWRSIQRSEPAIGLPSIAPAVRRGPALPRYGNPILISPRLGQGSFRVVVTDAYQRRCSITGERVLPVLQAAHIRPYSEGGEHRVDNGLLLRSDLHTLFDRGYVTATPDLRIEVSHRIREDFDNGRDYYALHGRSVRPPLEPSQRPSEEFLRWHNEQKFLG
jgi:putative restriction endonuclease